MARAPGSPEPLLPPLPPPPLVGLGQALRAMEEPAPEIDWEAAAAAEARDLGRRRRAEKKAREAAGRERRRRERGEARPGGEGGGSARDETALPTLLRRADRAWAGRARRDRATSPPALAPRYDACAGGGQAGGVWGGLWAGEEEGYADFAAGMDSSPFDLFPGGGTTSARAPGGGGFGGGLGGSCGGKGDFGALGAGFGEFGAPFPAASGSLTAHSSSTMSSLSFGRQDGPGWGGSRGAGGAQPYGAGDPGQQVEDAAASLAPPLTESEEEELELSIELGIPMRDLDAQAVLVSEAAVARRVLAATARGGNTARASTSRTVSLGTARGAIGTARTARLLLSARGAVLQSMRGPVGTAHGLGGAPLSAHGGGPLATLRASGLREPKGTETTRGTSGGDGTGGVATGRAATGRAAGDAGVAPGRAAGGAGMAPGRAAGGTAGASTARAPSTSRGATAILATHGASSNAFGNVLPPSFGFHAQHAFSSTGQGPTPPHLQPPFPGGAANARFGSSRSTWSGSGTETSRAAPGRTARGGPGHELARGRGQAAAPWESHPEAFLARLQDLLSAIQVDLLGESGLRAREDPWSLGVEAWAAERRREAEEAEAKRKREVEEAEAKWKREKEDSTRGTKPHGAGTPQDKNQDGAKGRERGERERESPGGRLEEVERDRRSDRRSTRSSTPSSPKASEVSTTLRLAKPDVCGGPFQLPLPTAAALACPPPFAPAAPRAYMRWEPDSFRAAALRLRERLQRETVVGERMNALKSSLSLKELWTLPSDAAGGVASTSFSGLPAGVAGAGPSGGAAAKPCAVRALAVDAARPERVVAAAVCDGRPALFLLHVGLQAGPVAAAALPVRVASLALEGGRCVAGLADGRVIGFSATAAALALRAHPVGEAPEDVKRAARLPAPAVALSLRPEGRGVRALCRDGGVYEVEWAHPVDGEEVREDGSGGGAVLGAPVAVYGGWDAGGGGEGGDGGGGRGVPDRPTTPGTEARGCDRRSAGGAADESRCEPEDGTGLGGATAAALRSAATSSPAPSCGVGPSRLGSASNTPPSRSRASTVDNAWALEAAAGFPTTHALAANVRGVPLAPPTGVREASLAPPASAQRGSVAPPTFSSPGRAPPPAARPPLPPTPAATAVRVLLRPTLAGAMCGDFAPPGGAFLVAVGDAAGAVRVYEPLPGEGSLERVWEATKAHRGAVRQVGWDGSASERKCWKVRERSAVRQRWHLRDALRGKKGVERRRSRRGETMALGRGGGTTRLGLLAPAERSPCLPARCALCSFRLSFPFLSPCPRLCVLLPRTSSAPAIFLIALHLSRPRRFAGHLARPSRPRSARRRSGWRRAGPTAVRASGRWAAALRPGRRVPPRTSAPPSWPGARTAAPCSPPRAPRPRRSRGRSPAERRGAGGRPRTRRRRAGRKATGKATRGQMRGRARTSAEARAAPPTPRAPPSRAPPPRPARCPSGRRRPARTPRCGCGAGRPRSRPRRARAPSWRSATTMAASPSCPGGERGENEGRGGKGASFIAGPQTRPSCLGAPRFRSPVAASRMRAHAGLRRAVHACTSAHAHDSRSSAASVPLASPSPRHETMVTRAGAGLASRVRRERRGGGPRPPRPFRMRGPSGTRRGAHDAVRCPCFSVRLWRLPPLPPGAPPRPRLPPPFRRPIFPARLPLTGFRESRRFRP